MKKILICIMGLLLASVLFADVAMEPQMAKLSEQATAAKILHCNLGTYTFDGVEYVVGEYIHGMPSVCKVNGKYYNIGEMEVRKRQVDETLRVRNYEKNKGRKREIQLYREEIITVETTVPTRLLEKINTEQYDEISINGDKATLKTRVKAKVKILDIYDNEVDRITNLLPAPYPYR